MKNNHQSNWSITQKGLNMYSRTATSTTNHIRRLVFQRLRSVRDASTDNQINVTRQLRLLIANHNQRTESRLA